MGYLLWNPIKTPLPCDCSFAQDKLTHSSKMIQITASEWLLRSFNSAIEVLFWFLDSLFIYCVYSNKKCSPQFGKSLSFSRCRIYPAFKMFFSSRFPFFILRNSCFRFSRKKAAAKHGKSISHDMSHTLHFDNSIVRQSYDGTKKEKRIVNLSIDAYFSFRSMPFERNNGLRD